MRLCDALSSRNFRGIITARTRSSNRDNWIEVAPPQAGGLDPRVFSSLGPITARRARAHGVHCSFSCTTPPSFRHRTPCPPALKDFLNNTLLQYSRRDSLGWDSP